MSKLNNNVSALDIKYDKIKIPDGIIAGNQQDELNLNRIIMADYTAKVSTFESAVNTISQEVKDIKENYLTASTFYRSGIVALVVLVGAAWALYSHMDTKYENRFSSIDQRFEKVESNIHSLDVRLTKVESRLDNVELRLTNVEKKLDNIDDKLDILIQQKQAKK
jgi:hypothetical protein|nr:MAG TPA: Protein of unknown function (DUF2730) [Bacteriophage sp.]